VVRCDRRRSTLKLCTAYPPAYPQARRNEKPAPGVLRDGLGGLLVDGQWHRMTAADRA